MAGAANSFPDPDASVAPLLVVRDLAQAVSFYRDLLGGVVEQQWDSYARLSLGSATLHLATSSPKTEDKPGISLEPPRDRSTVAGEVVLHVSQCREVHRELLARGVTFLAPPSEPPWGGEVRCFLQDPDGHLIEISQTET